MLHIAGLPLDSEEVSWLVNELIEQGTNLRSRQQKFLSGPLLTRS